jgi:ATP-dependent RNA helicase DeaD
MPPRIAAIAARHLRDPRHIEIGHEAVGEMPRVRQVAYIVARAHKVAALVRILDVEQPSMALVFCRTRVDVDVLTESLKARGFVAESLHGGLSQDQRDRVMGRFRAGSTELLIATDVAARGLDVRGLSHVVNHDMPADPDDYIHRIGRTGRAGGMGVAITLVEPREHRLLRDIERQTRQRVELARIPTAADLKARKLELTSAALREELSSGGLDGFRVIVDSLSQEFDVVDIALAAVTLAHRAQGADEDVTEIPQPTPPPAKTGAGKPGKFGDASKARPKGKRKDEADRDGLAPAARGSNPGRGKGGHGAPTGRLFLDVGREQGVRPGDLVGAIANEAGVAGKLIGAIQIADGFSLVELPEEILDEVVQRLKRTFIKGKKVVVRRDRAGDRG